MKKTKNMLALSLALTVLAASTAGCSSASSSTGTQAQGTTGQPQQTTGGTAQTDTSAADMAGGKLFSEPVELSMLIPSHPSWPYQEDWYVQKMVQEETNVSFEVTAVPNDGFTDKVNLTMASGQLPDLIYFIGNSAINQYAPQGAFVNILDHLDSMPNFKKWYEENQDFALNYLSADGGLYQFPEMGVDETNRRSWMYRKDIFDELNLKVPTRMNFMKY